MIQFSQDFQKQAAVCSFLHLAKERVAAGEDPITVLEETCVRVSRAYKGLLISQVEIAKSIPATISVDLSGLKKQGG